MGVQTLTKTGESSKCIRSVKPWDFISCSQAQAQAQYVVRTLGLRFQEDSELEALLACGPGHIAVGG